MPAQTLIQRETPPDMLGRVGSTNTSVVFLGQVAGLAVSGVLAEILGVRLVFFLCAVLSVALAIAGRLVPAVQEIALVALFLLACHFCCPWCI